MSRIIGYCTAAFTILWPPLGLGFATVYQILTRYQTFGYGLTRTRPWLNLWLAFFAPLLFINLIRSDWQGLEFTAGQFIICIALALTLRLPRKVAVLGLHSSLIILLCLTILEWQQTSKGWRIAENYPVQRGIKTLLPGETIKAESKNTVVQRSWRVTGSAPLELSFDIRLKSGRTGWDWIRSSQSVILEAVTADDVNFARITMPNQGDPYIAREIQLNTPIANQIFRLRATLRSQEKIPVGDCIGLRLREVGGSNTFQCFDTPFERNWQTLTRTWRAPPNASSNILRIALNNIDGHSFDIRDISLEHWEGGTWKPLGPLIPVGITAQLSWQHGDISTQPVQGAPLIPTANWQTYTLGTPEPNLQTPRSVTALLRVEGGLEVELRKVRLTTSSTLSQLKPERQLVRQQLWYGHSNLAGHTVAVAGLVASTLAASFLPLAGSGFTALVVVVLTGSRTALLALLIGLSLLISRRLWLLEKLPRRYKILGSFLGLFTVVFLLSTNRFDSQNVLNSVGRLEIWHVAWQAFASKIGTGWGYNATPHYWEMFYQGTSQEAVSHAHNFWLQFATSYGLLGLAAAFWLTGGFVYLAWRWGRWRGMALIIPVLVMNFFDYTLFYSGILFPLILGMNALREHGIVQDQA